eukprot:c25785_g4_i1 orf=25-1239(-)
MRANAIMGAPAFTGSLVPLAAVLSLLLLQLSQSELHSLDIQALKEVRSSVRDLPGSFFFDSWDFNHDPCGSFTGVVCAVVNGVMRVRELNLGSGVLDTPGLGGEINPSIGNLSALVQFTVAPGEVGGQIPESLGDLLQLEFLGISKNWLSGPIPYSLGALQSLETLDLSFNQLTGSIPDSLIQLPNLKALVLVHNNLVDSIPPISSPLEHLDLQDNILSGELPALPSSLGYVCLSKNELSGQFDNVVSLPNLWYLDLSFNRFTGSLPPAILKRRLTFLFLQHNRLTGSIKPPSSVNIAHLDLSYNEFSGSLSPLLATSTNLYLNNNHFTGEVPVELIHGFLSGSLRSLYLQHNYLSECKLETNFTAARSGGTLCIHYNCFLPPSLSSCPMLGKAVSRPAPQCTQ